MEYILVALAMFTAGQHVNDEPHWSFRDGCVAQTVTAPGGGYSYTSYDQCKSLPRVYNGKPWVPTENRPTLPSA